MESKSQHDSPELDHLETTKQYFIRVDAGRADTVDLFTEDAQIYFPKFGIARGKAAFGELASGLFKRVSKLSHDLSTFTHVVTPDVIVVEGKTQGMDVEGRQWSGGVWLERERKKVSTIDLAGQGEFSVITGVGGQDWVTAAQALSAELGIPIKGYRVGLRQEYDDVLGEWTRLREIDDHGCLLVRPDRFIAWRSQSRVADPKKALRSAMQQILR
jgi:hypothetical protein